MRMEPVVRLDPHEVRHIARLARLELSEAEVERFGSQLTRILEYVDQLRALPLEGVEPLTHPLDIRDVVRDDVPAASLPLELAVRGAPKRHGPFFAVPPVLEGESGA